MGKGRKLRVTVALEPKIHNWLSERANQEGRPLASLAGHLLSVTVKGEIDESQA